MEHFSSRPADAYRYLLMTPLNESQEVLIQDIRRAFRDVRRCDISLHQARLLDDVYFPTPEQMRDAGAKDTDDRWEDVPDENVGSLSNALPFLDAGGRHYYLPRFMVYALKPPSTSQGGVEDATFFTLVNVDTYRDEFETFTKEQRAVVSRFLHRMSTQEYPYDADEEAIRYWDDLTNDVPQGSREPRK